MGKNKKKAPKPYTLNERVEKVTTIYKNLKKFGLYIFLTNEIKDEIRKFVEEGKEYHNKLEKNPPSSTKIPPFTIIIDFINDKRFDKKNNIGVKFKKS
jgi:hypothetical protein